MHASHIERQAGRSSQPPVVCPETDLVAACRLDAPILFTGEASAAESLARYIHASSGWRYGPFVAVDCGMPESELAALLRSLLPEKPGTQEFQGFSASLTQQGVVFLRDIGRLSPAGQATVADWLTRLTPFGRSGPRRRVMASSSSPLVPQWLGGTFDDDLYYRLNVMRIPVTGVQQS